MKAKNNLSCLPGWSDVIPAHVREVRRAAESYFSLAGSCKWGPIGLVYDTIWHQIMDYVADAVNATQRERSRDEPANRMTSPNGLRNRNTSPIKVRKLA